MSVYRFLSETNAGSNTEAIVAMTESVKNLSMDEEDDHANYRDG